MAVLRRNGNEFAADVGDYVVRMKDLTKLVWQESMLELVRRMQMPLSSGGRMPVVTGFLRASFRISTSPIAIGTRERPGPGPYGWSIDEVVGQVRAFKVGQRVYMGYEAIYADRIEYGAGSFPGYAFQRLAVQLWPVIVQQTFARLSAA